jgi:hypothetical protein
MRILGCDFFFSELSKWNQKFGYIWGLDLDINPLKAKRILSDIKTQGVPRSKHSLPQFKKSSI